MSAEQLQALYLILGLVGGSGGLWFVVKQLVGYQHDFTDRYAAENRQLISDVAALREQVDAAREDTRICEQGRLADRITMAGMQTEISDLKKALLLTKRSTDPN